MKNIILTLFLIITCTVCKSQTKLAELKIFDAKYILSNVIEFKSHSFTNYHITTYVFANESGSAHINGTDEVSYSILIVKIEFGEYEIPKFYMIKDVYNAKIINTKEDEITINVNNGKVDKKYQF